MSLRPASPHLTGRSGECDARRAARRGGLTPGGNTGENFRGQAIQSRLGIRTSTQTDIGEVKTQIEGDFFGSGGGNFRLRHANITVGNWLFGRTWTNFMPIESYPSTVDFQGPAGIPFARQTQFRYTARLSDTASASFSIENAAGTSSDPVFTAALSYKTANAFLKLAALAGTVNAGGTEFDRWGVNLSGNAGLWKGGGLNASFTTGEAIDSYMVFGGPDLRGGQASESSGITVGLTQDLSDKVRFGLAYGLRENDFPAAAETDTLDTIHATLFFTPTERLTVGAEVIWGERTLGNGLSEDATRLQTSVQFNF